MKNAFFLIFLASLGIAGLWHASSKRSDCFSPAFIKTPSELFSQHSPQKSIPSSLLPILTQEFRFLGSGNQCYAFESQDEKYVLKVIKFHCLTENYGINWLPSWDVFQKVKAQHDKAQQQKLERVLQGFIVANRYNQTHCGLLFLHFPKTSVDIKTSLRDKAGRRHQINLNEVVFVLQYKAKPTQAVLHDLLRGKNLEQAANHMAALLAMIAEDLNQGLYDHDHNIMHNTGFRDLEPMRMDFGKLVINEAMKDPVFRFQELNKIADQRILSWIAKYYPSYYQYFNEFIREILSKYSP